MVDINNPMNYKNCAKKSYTIHVCMPPEGTVVINKLEQADAVRLLNGRTYFTIKELEHMQSNGDGRFHIISQLISQGRAYLVSKNTPFVLAGTLGELWTISADKLAKTYTFLQNNSALAINQQTLEKRLVGNYLNWTLVKTSSSATSGQNMACFVPSREKCQVQTSWGAVLQVNGDGVSHGKGDFIVCTKLPNGQPNINDRWVVNGNIFATTYNNQGWTDCIKVNNSDITIDALPKLFDASSLKQDKTISKESFANKIRTLFKELQKFYKFDIVEDLSFSEVMGYRGFMPEVNFTGRTYLASAVVGGTFLLKTKTDCIKTDKTSIHFAVEADYADSAIIFSIKPNTSSNYSSGCVFPIASKKCRCSSGTINDINCAEEVARFAKFGGNRDAMIDNRHSKSTVAKPLKELYNYFKGHEKIKLLEDRVQFLSNSYILYENNHFIFEGGIKARFNNIEDAKSCIRDVLKIFPKGIFSSFYAPKMSSTTFQALVDYSGTAYRINTNLLDKTALSFNQFLLYTELNDFLSRCKINRHITLFRGMDLDNSVEIGSIIPGGNFMSTSLSIEVADSFGTCIFRIKDAYGVNGFFLNSISEFRNREYEILINNEYDIKVESLFYTYHGYPVYNCSLVKSSKTINTSKLADDDSIFMLNLYNSITCIPSIDTKGIVQTNALNSYNINIFFAKNSKNIFKLCITKNDKKLEVSANYNGNYSTKTELVVNADSEGVTKVLSYIEDIIRNIAISSDYSMLVYNRMAQEFTNNGFLVLNDTIEDDKFKLVLTGDNDDKIVVTFNVDITDDKLRIRVRGRSNGNKLDKTKIFDSLDNLLTATYTLIVSSFKLNCANRSDKVINLIAGYLGYSVSRNKNSSETIIYYKFGNYSISASIFNTNIEYTIVNTGETMLCSHFDNIHTIASNLYSKLGVRSNDNL